MKHASVSSASPGNAWKLICRRQITALGVGPVADTPEEFGAYIKSEIARRGDIIRRSIW